MLGLKKYLIAEEERLKNIDQVIDKRLIDVPEGNLRITSSGKHIQYMHCKEKGTRNARVIQQMTSTVFWFGI